MNNETPITGRISVSDLAMDNITFTGWVNYEVLRGEFSTDTLNKVVFDLREPESILSVRVTLDKTQKHCFDDLVVPPHWVCVGELNNTRFYSRITD